MKKQQQIIDISGLFRTGQDATADLLEVMNGESVDIETLIDMVKTSPIDFQMLNPSEPDKSVFFTAIGLGSPRLIRVMIDQGAKLGVIHPRTRDDAMDVVNHIIEKEILTEPLKDMSDENLEIALIELKNYEEIGKMIYEGHPTKEKIVSVHRYPLQNNRIQVRTRKISITKKVKPQRELVETEIARRHRQAVQTALRQLRQQKRLDPSTIQLVSEKLRIQDPESESHQRLSRIHKMPYDEILESWDFHWQQEQKKRFQRSRE